MYRMLFPPQSLLTGLLVSIALSLVPTAALAVGTVESTTLTLRLAADEFDFVDPVFSNVRSFVFEIDLAGPLAPGAIVENSIVEEVRYEVRGGLNLDPPTPSGFPAFALNRFPSGEQPISREDWLSQSSRLVFQIAPSAVLGDGLQASELLPLESGAPIFELDAREFERGDVARYHPPQLVLYADGTGQLQNAKNSSGDSGTVNPATREEVDVAFGEEYITFLGFDPETLTLIDAPVGTPVPEPGTALLLGLGLAGLGRAGRR